MKPVDRTVFGDGKGNCFAAAIASLLEVPISHLPDLAHQDQQRRLWEWLRPRGLTYLSVDAVSAMFMACELGWHEISGMGPRGVPHSVVGYQGEIRHDPHPSRAGLLPDENGERAWQFGFLLPLDPAATREG